MARSSARGWWGGLAGWWRRLRQPPSLGQRGERAACRYLRRRGYKIVARGQRGRIGELDIVAVDRNTVVFVEVKTRASHEAGDPVEAVGPAKQGKLTALATAFLKRHGLLEASSRFDIVAVTWPPEARKPQIKHYRNAFEAAE